MKYEVKASDFVKKRIKNFSKAEKLKIHRFINAFQTGGFQAIDKFLIDEYKVRNKNSDDVRTEDFQFIEKVRFAQKYKLWHYHAGFYNTQKNEYPIDNGYKLSNAQDLISQWVIHYQKISDVRIILVDIKPHPPMDILALPIEKSDETNL